ncbi:MAG: hypothetical protein LCI02_19465 [Proteobacteria bacterium]|nr:hypothetical protein [Pseudomonadota bacterium]
MLDFKPIPRRLNLRHAAPVDHRLMAGSARAGAARTMAAFVDPRAPPVNPKPPAAAHAANATHATPADPAAGDTLDHCAGLPPAHPVALLRHQRPALRAAAQSAFDALWLAPEGRSRVAHERSLVALRVAALLEDAPLVAACRAQALKAGAGAAELARAMPASEADTLTALNARLTTLLMFVDRITLQPAAGTARQLEAMARLDFGPAAIVGLAQGAAVMAVLARVVAGVRAIAAAGERGAAPSIASPGAAAGLLPGHHPAAPARALRGRFTMDGLAWRPWLPPVDPAQATPAQQGLLAQWSPASRRSSFELTMLHTPSLRAPQSRLLAEASRAAGGLPWSERALVAAAVARQDGCTFGASMLGRIVSRMTRDAEVMGMLFAQGVNLPLPPRRRALVDLAVDLAAVQPRVAAGRIEALRAAGCSELEILDAVHAAAAAAGDDRLALTLGEAVPHPG